MLHSFWPATTPLKATMGVENIGAAVALDIAAENKGSSMCKTAALACALFCTLLSGCGPEPPTPEPPSSSTYDCGDNVSVCNIGDAQKRCESFKTFSEGGNGLIAGFMNQETCCESAVSENGKQACFEHDKNVEYFSNYSASYCLNDGTHTAFVWGTPSTFSNQSNRSLISEYYGGYIGANKRGFNLTLVWETANAEFAVARNACAGGTEWKYFLFGFASDTFDYGVGFDVLSPTSGCIVRQTATGQAPAQDQAAGFIANPPNSVADAGNVGRAYNRYLKAFQDGCAECIASLYAPDSKIFFYSSRGDTDWNKYYPDFKVFTGADIEAYYKKLFATLGSDYDVAPQVQDCAESNAAFEVPPFCYVAYEIRSPEATSKYATNLIFTENGKIYGEGVVSEIKGLGDRIEAPATPSGFANACEP